MSEQANAAFSRKPVETAEEALRVVSWAADTARERDLHGVASELELVGVYVSGNANALTALSSERDLLRERVNIYAGILEAHWDELSDDEKAELCAVLDTGVTGG